MGKKRQRRPKPLLFTMQNCQTIYTLYKTMETLEMSTEISLLCHYMNYDYILIIDANGSN